MNGPADIERRSQNDDGTFDDDLELDRRTDQQHQIEHGNQNGRTTYRADNGAPPA